MIDPALALRNKRWHTLAQVACIVLAAVALKQFYQTARAEDLRWILGPTAALVQAGTGVTFEFEAGAGYFNRSLLYLIAPSCAGVNFLIAATGMLGFALGRQIESPRGRWLALLISAGIAYGVTLLANAARIGIALGLYRANAAWSVLNPARVHRLAGIAVYFVFLLGLYLVSRNLLRRRTGPGRAGEGG